MEGDFLDDKYRAILQDSNTIFVNNFAFGPSLNHKLKERFAKFAEGVKIISSSEFRPINFRITTRNITGKLGVPGCTHLTPGTSVYCVLLVYKSNIIALGCGARDVYLSPPGGSLCTSMSVHPCHSVHTRRLIYFVVPSCGTVITGMLDKCDSFINILFWPEKRPSCLQLCEYAFVFEYIIT